MEEPKDKQLDPERKESKHGEEASSSKETSVQGAVIFRHLMNQKVK